MILQLYYCKFCRHFACSQWLRKFSDKCRRLIPRLPPASYPSNIVMADIVGHGSQKSKSWFPISIPQNCLCSHVPLIFRPLFPCSPKKLMASFFCFPKPLGGFHDQYTCVQYRHLLSMYTLLKKVYQISVFFNQAVWILLKFRFWCQN